MEGYKRRFTSARRHFFRSRCTSSTILLISISILNKSNLFINERLILAFIFTKSTNFHLIWNIISCKRIIQKIIFHDIKICFFLETVEIKKIWYPAGFPGFQKNQNMEVFCFKLCFEKVKTHYFCPFSITVSLDRRTSASENR